METRDGKYWIDRLKLQQHPEGGWYHEAFRSDEEVPAGGFGGRYEGERNVYTSIYFLLNKNEYSAFHRLQSDELWYFHAGTALKLYVIDEDGVLTTRKLGNNPEKGEELQLLARRNTWFASEVEDKNSYSLIGCMVAPGFDFRDFEMAEPAALAEEYPEHGELIRKLGGKNN